MQQNFKAPMTLPLRSYQGRHDTKVCKGYIMPYTNFH